MPWKALACTALLAPGMASAGWFDQVLKETRQAVDETVRDAARQAAGEDQHDDAPPKAPARSAPSSPPKHTAPGYNRAMVREIQQRLNALGHDAGTPDGVYGPGTGRAIRAFESERGLAVTGRPSESLLAALRAAEPVAPATAPKSASATPVAALNDLPPTTSGAKKVAKAPLKGRWQGQLRPKGKGGPMSYGTFDIVLSEQTQVLRYGSFGTACLAELDGDNGSYRANFVTGRSACGSRGSLTLDADGNATFRWDDAPNTPPEQRIYSGSLQRTRPAWPLAWSSDASQRDAFDVIGFKLGMSYEDALAYLKSAHPDLAHEWRAIVDEGSTTIVEQLTQKDAQKLGPTITHGEQLSLLFETQTPQQMRVEQDPAVLKRRADIEQMEKQRAEQQRRQREEQRTKLRSMSRQERAEYRLAQRQAHAEAAPPPLPEKPALRPSGADAELLVIGRLMTFSGNQRPHEAKVTRALTDKYGTPSARVDQGPRRFLEWVFDREGRRIASAKGGPCDHISKAPGRIEGLVDYYGTKGIQVDVPPTVSPACGLTVKAQLNYNDRDRGVYRMSVIVYDQQRLLGDEWYKVVQFTQALAAKEVAKQQATQRVAAPDL